jgi:hypothetical protein
MTAPERGPATIAPELARRLGNVARALVAAGRSWARYPPEHPAVQISIDEETDGRGDFRYAVEEALDPESVEIDPLAHV